MAEQAVPRGLRVRETAVDVQIAYRWFRGKYLLITLWVIAFGYGAVQIAFQRPIDRLEITGAFLVPLLLGYYTLTGFVNRSTVHVSRDGVRVTHGPLPLLRSRAWPAGAFVSIRTALPADRTWEDHSIRPINIAVYADLANGRRATILSGLPHYPQADFIARAIVRFGLAPRGLLDS